MASSSLTKHDVFLCFRGEDVRAGFASHLYAALRRRRIEAFEDDDDDDWLERGSKEMKYTKSIEAIAESKICVVIFSENFSSSKLCLKELVEMLKMEKIVMPVFYHVDSSDVEKQTGRFARVFEKHEKRFGKETVQKWRDALTEAAGLTGWISDKKRDEAALVELIAEELETKLKSPKRKAALERAFVITNLILELPSAAFDQLSSVHKPMYCLAGMLISFLSLIFCISDLIHKGKTQKVRWQWSWPVPWFYHSSPSSKRFGSFLDTVGFSWAICQFIATTINYSFIRQGVDVPIKISVWPLVFAFGLSYSTLRRSTLRRHSGDRSVENVERPKIK